MEGGEEGVPPPPPSPPPPPQEAPESHPIHSDVASVNDLAAQSAPENGQHVYGHWVGTSQQYPDYEAYNLQHASAYEYDLGQQAYATLPASNPLPPAKRQRTENDGLASALGKIKSHISNPRKFLKASPLLRQLFTEEKLSGAHGDLVFECLKGAMKNANEEVFERADMRKEYIKLFSIASNNSQIFSAREKLQLDVYGLLAVLRNQIITDDSFVLNRILSRIKDSIHNLPEADEGDDQVLQSFQERCQPDPNTAVPASTEEGNEGHVDRSLDVPSQEPTWSEQESLCMKREALITCLQAAKQLHGKQWASTSIEIAYEEALKHLHKFCTPQRSKVEDLGRFAQAERLARQQGRAAAREDRRDRSAFETARKEFSKVTGISNRKAVGSGGDHHTEVWLG